ncbi:MAG: carbon monoxide dehydrogenase subunit G [Solirubrobacterales bacterium]
MARVDGSETLALARERVWELLNDPEMLGAAIPGCRGLERDEEEEHRYRTSIAVAIGAVKGVYDGTVVYADIAEPERCTIKVSGRGEKGTIDGQGEIELRAAEAGTEVAYRGEFKLTGPVAGIGQRLAPGVSRKMIIETLRQPRGERRSGRRRRGRRAARRAGSEPAALRSPAGGPPTAARASEGAAAPAGGGGVRGRPAGPGP